MVVQMDLTEKMISSFNDCARKGDYTPFVEENKKFVKNLSDELKKVHFDKNETISLMVSKNLSFYFNYLTQWNPRDAYCVVRGVKLLEQHTPALTNSLKDSIATKDWSNFYSAYRPTADFMIREARNQNIFDFQIWYGSSSYDTFEDRDFVAQSIDQYQHLPPVHQEKPVDERNDRGMILFEGKQADNYRAEQQLNNIHRQKTTDTWSSGGNGVTTVPIFDEPRRNGQFGQNNLGRRLSEINYNRNIENTQATSRPHDNSQVSRNGSGTSRGNKSFEESKFAASSPPSCGDGNGIPLSPEQDSRRNDSPYTRSTGLSSYGSPKSQITSLPQDPKRDRHYGSSRPDEADQNHHSNISFNSDRKVEPLEKYIPAISTDELRSMQLPKSPFVHSRESPQRSDDYNTSQQISEYRNDIEKFSEIRPRDILESTSPRRTDSSREMSMNCDSPLDNSVFDRELAEQKMRNDVELEERKKERQKKQKVFEEEFRKLKEESRRRFDMLLRCILAKHRFEIQEEKWADWIRGCKQNLNTLLNRFNDFAEDIERDQKGLRRPDKIDHQELQNSVNDFLHSIMFTYNILQLDFENLKNIEITYPDALFVRVLMKCLADVAEKLLKIYSMTENMGSNRFEYLDLQSKLGALTPNLIYSTSQLRSICETAYSSNYQNILFPEIKQNLKIQEFY